MDDNPITLIRRSAQGDFGAHRALAELSIAAGLGATDNGENAFFAYYEASIFSRMAASSGLLIDRARLMAVLAICAELASQDGNDEESDVYVAESIAIAELVADAGDGESSEYAAQIIANSAGDCSHGQLMRAKEFKQIWGQV